MAGGTVGPTVGAVDFRILGPLEVWYEGRPIPVPGAKQRALLAMLLLHAGEVVSADRMLDAVWGEDPPDAGSTALRVRLSQLRKTLAGAGSSLVTRPPGYVMQLRDDELDLRRCERLVAAGDRALQEGRAAEAVDALRDALALWRGPPLADLAYESFAQAPIVRLEELRLAALELRVEAELSLGHHGPLVGELQELVRLHPMRERLCCQLMLALYRDGRQSDALDAYRTARRRLVDEVGIEPGPQLQQLEGQILAQDPRLDLEPDASVRTAVRTPTRSVLVIADDDLEDIAAIAEPLAAGDGRELIVAALVTESDELDPALARLHAVRAGALERGAHTRVTAFTSVARGDDVVRLAAEHEAALLLLALPHGALDEDAITVLAHAVCDVGLVAGAGRRAAVGTEVLVPFAGSEHDWAAVELGSWLAAATAAPLRLVGTRGDPGAGRRDASRLIASASLALQRGLGVAVEQALVGPGSGSMIEAAEAAAVVVSGLSDRWVSQGIGPARLELARGARPPVILVRRGLRPGGLAPAQARTRFTWSGVRG
jgi:DNA-binding SARP family transcriptional activator